MRTLSFLRKTGRRARHLRHSSSTTVVPPLSAAAQMNLDKLTRPPAARAKASRAIASTASLPAAAAAEAVQPPTGPFDETMRDFLSPSSFFDMLYYRGVTQPVNICSVSTFSQPQQPADYSHCCVEVLLQFSSISDRYYGVPDSLMKDFLSCLYDRTVEMDDAHMHILTANEGSAIAMAAGYHIATGKVPLVYLQNSGIGNAVNPLLSLADPDVYSIPMLLLVGWRGEPGKRDEPQHRIQGHVTPGMLAARRVLLPF